MNPLDLINNADSAKLGLSLSSEITFGKHKGETIKEILSYDASYIRWLIDNTDKIFSQEVIHYDFSTESDYEDMVDSGASIGDLPF